MHFDYSQHKQKGFSALPIIAGILIIALISGGGYYFYNQQQIKNINSYDECAEKYPVMLSYPGQCNTSDGRHFVQVLSEAEKEKLKPPPVNNLVDSELSSCLEEKMNQNKGDYAKGEILVGFNTSGLDKSKELIVSSGLDYEEEYSSKSLNFLKVKVTPGEEFKWMCVLEEDPNIKYAELNQIIKLDDCNKGPC